jgi:hypothetical protein
MIYRCEWRLARCLDWPEGSRKAWFYIKNSVNGSIVYGYGPSIEDCERQIEDYLQSSVSPPMEKNGCLQL